MGLSIQDDRTRKRFPGSDRSEGIRDERGLESAMPGANPAARKVPGSMPASTAGLIGRSGFIGLGLRVALILLSFFSGFGGLGAERAAEIVAPEHQVKAAYIFKFGVFVTWPENAFANPSAPFVIGVIGNEPVARVLQDISKNQTIHGRKIEMRRMRAADDFTELQVVFVGKGQNAKGILNRIGAASVLTIGEEAGFAESGGMLNLILEDERMLFDANSGAISKTKLEVTSKVLRLARRIVETQPDGNGGNP